MHLFRTGQSFSMWWTQFPPLVTSMWTCLIIPKPSNIPNSTSADFNWWDLISAPKLMVINVRNVEPWSAFLNFIYLISHAYTRLLQIMNMINFFPLWLLLVDDICCMIVVMWSNQPINGDVQYSLPWAHQDWFAVCQPLKAFSSHI
jgi:hypothetical protein